VIRRGGGGGVGGKKWEEGLGRARQEGDGRRRRVYSVRAIFAKMSPSRLIFSNRRRTNYWMVGGGEPPRRLEAAKYGPGVFSIF
jgi:hypothetical protein